VPKYTKKTSPSQTLPGREDFKPISKVSPTGGDSEGA